MKSVLDSFPSHNYLVSVPFTKHTWQQVHGAREAVNSTSTTSFAVIIPAVQLPPCSTGRAGGAPHHWNCTGSFSCCVLQSLQRQHSLHLGICSFLKGQQLPVLHLSAAEELRSAAEWRQLFSLTLLNNKRETEAMCLFSQVMIFQKSLGCASCFAVVFHDLGKAYVCTEKHLQPSHNKGHEWLQLLKTCPGF